MRHSLLALAVILLSATLTTHVVAQDDTRAQARENFQSGVEHFEGGDYDDALASFQAAYDLRPHYSVRGNIANCLERLGRTVEARQSFRAYLSEAGDSARPEQLQEVRDAIERLSAGIGSLSLDVNPAGATVSIDGASSHQAPLSASVELSAGLHSVAITMDGYRSTNRQVMIEGASEATLRVSLRSLVAEVATPEPAAEPEPEPTEDTEEEEFGDDFDDEAGATPYDDVELSEEPTGPGFVEQVGTPTLIAGGAAIGLAIAGIATGIAAIGADGDFEDAVIASNDDTLSAEERADARQNGIDAADRASGLAMVSDIMFAGALIGAGVATYFYVTREESSDVVTNQRRLRATPAISHQGVGVLVQGSF